MTKKKPKKKYIFFPKLENIPTYIFCSDGKFFKKFFIFNHFDEVFVVLMETVFNFTFILGVLCDSYQKKRREKKNLQRVAPLILMTKEHVFLHIKIGHYITNFIISIC